MALLRAAALSSLLCVVALAGCSGSDSDDDGARADVAIHGNAYSPQSITVTKGTEVYWENHDSVSHTVTADVSGGFDSGNIAGGGDYEHKFEQAGTFAYHCKIHSTMHGTITVTS